MEAFAECGGRPVNACELVNNDDQIFIARAISSAGDNPFLPEWRMRVVRSFRGRVRGEILVSIGSHYDSSSGETLKADDEYLFYASKTNEDGHVVYSTGTLCSNWLPLAAVGSEELDFLGKLGRRVDDGRVMGKVVSGFLDRHPLAGIRVVLYKGRHSYSATSGPDGSFEVVGLSQGKYGVTLSGLPDGVQFNGDGVEIVAHGCVDGVLKAQYETSVSGRLILPRGIKPGGLGVFAWKAGPGNGFVDSASPDADGRYTFRGLNPGDYLIGIEHAPYLRTYAPGTTNAARASKIHITGATTIGGVDIDVPLSAETVHIDIRATFEDGRPVQAALIRVIKEGGVDLVSERTNFQGLTPLSFGRGDRAVVSAGDVDGRCTSPVSIGPDTYPASILFVYAESRCR